MELQIGDKLYYRQGFSGQPVYAGAVSRVTKTQATVIHPINFREFKVKRDYTSGYVYAIGDTEKWSRTAYYLLTPEIEKEIEYNNFRGKHAAIILKWADNNLSETLRELPDDALVKIAEIISNLPV